MKKRYILIIPLLGGFLGAFAQQKPSKPINPDTAKVKELQEVVVRDTRRKLKNDTLSQTLKLDQPLLTMPQNIVSISSAVLVDQGVFNLRDAARNSSGTYFGLNNNVFDGASNLYMRGLPQNGIVRNGLPTGDYGHSQDDESVIERIEFIKGPAGFLGGSGEAGGRINVVTKVPTDNNILNATLTAGSFNFYRAAVDAGSAVKEKGFSYRFNAAYNYQQYFVDIMKSNKFIIAPVIQYNFSKRTSILAEYVLNNQTAIGGSTYTKFFAQDKMLTDDRHANYQADPGLPNSYSKSQYGRIVIKHEFNDNWKITSQSSFYKTPSETWSFLAEETGYNAVGFDANGIAHRLSFRTYNNGRGASTQLFLNGKFKTGEKITHRLLFGGEYVLDKDSTFQSYGTKSFELNINNLKYGLSRDELQGNQETFNGFRYDNNFAAVYLYNTTSISDKFFIQFGGRYTYNKRENSGIFAPETKTLKQKAFTPRVGLTYLIDKSTSIFALYDQSFVPTAGQDKEGKAFVPIRGEDREIGLKRDWFGGNLSTTITGFDMARNNMVTVDPSAPTFNVQLGQVRSKGIELDIIGRVVSNVTISANYAYSNVKVTKDNNPALVGQRYASAPRQVINTWLRYTFPADAVPGLSLALGQTTIIKKATTTPDTYIPNYTKLDGSVAYTYRKVTTRLLLDNLTNKRYILAGDIYNGNGYYTEGMPFNFKLSVAYRL
ncbi:TonB-dependent siderophore receptor [uncultured Pedobacter sp.]|uniref:TonB-dependent siderophore receptor n=1 Tax=uncultured Pedobacter sp. TaxID=246139 RepID=UPI0025D59FA1|nr:TonB-dependent siderophore receptor [uncultured Pedobacter sp.]